MFDQIDKAIRYKHRLHKQLKLMALSHGAYINVSLFFLSLSLNPNQPNNVHNFS